MDAAEYTRREKFLNALKQLGEPEYLEILRLLQKKNIHYSEKSARADWEKRTKEHHNLAYKLDADYDSGFVRHPLRKFTGKEYRVS